MIRYFSFEPELFNNNGDQGNITVLATVLEHSGNQLVSADFDSADFVLIGDCSIAVLERFKPQLDELLPRLIARLDNGLPTLLVGRSYEHFAPGLGIKVTNGLRESKFVVEQAGTVKAFGYHNSELASPRLFMSGNFVGTTLFGPLFAKNPELLESMAKYWGLNVSSDFYEKAKSYASEVREATSFE